MKKYIVRLTEKERIELCDICSKGRHSARKIRKANILLESDKGRTDEEISTNLYVGLATVERTRRRFVEGNLTHALSDTSRVGRPRKYDGIQRTALVALACTTPPEGRAAWTAELLAQRMVKFRRSRCYFPKECSYDSKRRRSQAVAKATMVHSRN